jgi:hypothetical protein
VAWARGQLLFMRMGPHPHALWLGSLRSLATAAGAPPAPMLETIS